MASIKIPMEQVVMIENTEFDGGAIIQLVGTKPAEPGDDNPDNKPYQAIYVDNDTTILVRGGYILLEK